MAAWARGGTPNRERLVIAARLFEEQAGSPDEPNWQQCRALTHAVLGDRELIVAAGEQAIEQIRLINRREFSCWTYSNVGQAKFERHVAHILQFGEGTGPMPLVLRHPEPRSHEPVQTTS